MITMEEAQSLHGIIEQAMDTASDEIALACPSFTEAWRAGKEYEAGKRVSFGDRLYRCLQTHTALEEWTPDAAPSLWTRVLIVDPDLIPEWIQPDSTNAYMTGDKVMHNGRTWISTIDNNVWEPGVYGWQETE